MIQSKAKLAKYQADRKAIAAIFFTSVADAEETCEHSSKSAHGNSEQNAAQAAFKTQIRTAAHIRSDAIEALGPSPLHANRK